MVVIVPKLVAVVSAWSRTYTGAHAVGIKACACAFACACVCACVDAGDDVDVNVTVSVLVECVIVLAIFLFGVIPLGWCVPDLEVTHDYGYGDAGMVMSAGCGGGLLFWIVLLACVVCLSRRWC